MTYDEAREERLVFSVPFLATINEYAGVLARTYSLPEYAEHDALQIMLHCGRFSLHDERAWEESRRCTALWLSVRQQVQEIVAEMEVQR